VTGELASSDSRQANQASTAQGVHLRRSLRSSAQSSLTRRRSSPLSCGSALISAIELLAENEPAKGAPRQ
jgi:hypothetical protein